MRKHDEEELPTVSTALGTEAIAATRVKGKSRGHHQTLTFYFIRFGTLLGLFVIAGCYDPNRHAQFFPYAQPVVQPPAELETVQLKNEITDDLRRPPSEPFTLGPGDRIELELIGDVTSRTTTAVGPDGRIYFHLLSGVDVWGRTLSDTKALLEKGLSDYIKEQPQVAVTLKGIESQRVWLLGCFQSPGVYSLTNGPMTLLEAISLAGGPASLSGNQQSNFAYSSEDLADLRRAFIVRQGQLLPVDFQRLLKQGDLSQNIYLRSDDFIYFPTAAGREVYVLGAVNAPRAVPYNDELTLASAIANAQGTGRDAYWDHVAVVRGSLSNPQIAVINYKAVLKGELRDVKLEPQDIVYVPFTPYRHLKRYLNIILDTFVSSVAINEGTRAVLSEEDAGPTGIVIPLGSRISVTPPAGSSVTPAR